VFDALMATLSTNAAIRVEGPLVRIAGFHVELTPDQAALRDRITATLKGAGLSGVSSKDLHTNHPEEETNAVIHLLESAGGAVEVAGVGWTDPDALEGLRTALLGWFSEHEALSPGGFKELTGLTRKSAIPLLEWLDKHRWTRRDGDARVAGRALRAPGLR
jgi:selenocysteine-specific elongation factor